MQASPAAGSVCLAQKNVASAGLRQSGAKLGPNASVEKRQQSAREPREQALRPAHRLHDERNHDERPDADHERHVE